MNARSLELFKALTEASFWFYTHPKDTSYRLIYNKSRYTLDKARIMKMLRLYMPFVRRLDDQALVTYMYRNGGVVMAQMQSGQLGNLDIISEALPNTLQAVNTLDLAAQQKAIDEAIAKEEEDQKKKEEEKKKKAKEKEGGSSFRKTAPPRVPTPTEKTRLEDLARRAEKSDLSVANSGGMVISPVNIPVSLIPPVIEKPTLVVANKSGVVVETASKSSLIIPSGRATKVGPDRFERAVGGTVGVLSGSPVMDVGKKLSSVGQIWVRKGSDYANREIRRRFSRNDSRYSRYGYTEEEEDDDYVSYGVAPKKEKKVWVFLGFGIWGWVLTFVGLTLIFSLMSGGDELMTSTKEIKKPGLPVASGGGADYSACKFTRAGVSKGVGSSILAGWIQDVADKEGIPVAVMASVAMHENPDFTANAKNDHDGIVSGRMCGKSPTFCVGRDNQVLHSRAYGDGANDPCTSAEIAGGAKTAQAVGLMQFLDIYNPDKDLCDIKVSLGLAAAKLKGSGLGANPTEDQVTKAIKDYHVSCFYGSYNYCTEVYADFQNCKPKVGAEGTCQGGWPVSGPINQGPWGGSHGVYQGKGMVAVDIGADNGTPVYSTFKGVINALSYVDTGFEDGRGLFVSIQPDLPGKNAVVRYLHFSQLAEGLKVGQVVDAGALLGYVGNSGRSDGSHLHMDFLNIEMVPPYVPEAIRPLDCVRGSCQPQRIKVCR